MDPKRLGWFDWKIINSDNLEISLISDDSVQFYGFDLAWECNEEKETPTQSLAPPTQLRVQKFN